MSALVHTEMGLQVRAGSALAAIAERELPVTAPELVKVCAWCGDGQRVPDLGQAISHGICPTCAEAMRADYRAVMHESAAESQGPRGANPRGSGSALLATSRREVAGGTAR